MKRTTCWSWPRPRIEFKEDVGQFAHSNVITILEAHGEIAHQKLVEPGHQGIVALLDNSRQK